MQFFLAFDSYSSKIPFDPSMMVHFRKRFLEEELNRINELIAVRGKAMVIEAVASLLDEDDSDDPDSDAGNQLAIDDLVNLQIGQRIRTGEHSVSMPLARQPTSPIRLIKLLNEARASTERIIDDLYNQHSKPRIHKPRYNRGRASAAFLNVAKQTKSRRRKIKAAIRRQLDYLQRNLDAIAALITSGATLSGLKTNWWQKLLVISELHRQQSILLYS